ncbi:MAG: hypothetical protein AAF998_12220 [Bacteroidota bacterium]
MRAPNNKFWRLSVYKLGINVFAMKSTMIGTLALGLVAAVAGGVFKTFDLAGGNGLLLVGVFLSLMGSALLVLHLAGKPETER